MDFKDLINSAISTAIAELIMTPVCLVKTNYQNNNLSMIQMSRDIYTKYGIKGFYSAGPIAIFTQVFSTSSKYFVYKSICKTRGGNPYINNLIGCLCISLLTHPLDWIKINQQMHVSDIIKKITSNPFIVYKGYSKTFGKTLITAPLFFPLQEELKTLTGSGMIGSILASTIATITMQPFDYLKNRQMYGNSLYDLPGIRPYFKGLSLNLFRIVPHFTIVMGMTDYLNNR